MSRSAEASWRSRGIWNAYASSFKTWSDVDGMWVDGWGKLPGHLVVISGPSGSGKSTLIRRALDRPCLSNMQLSVSATTRPPRPGETEGVDYFFMDHEEFLSARGRNEFLEWAEF